MDTLAIKNNERNYASLIHLSLLTKYIIPFGNYLFPIIMWGSKKDTSEFIDHNGKQAINFQLSFLLYSILIFLFSVPTLLYTLFSNVSRNEIENGNFIYEKLTTGNITGMVTLAIIAVVLFCLIKVAEFFLIIYGAVKSNNGEHFKYPFTINFLK